LSATAKPLITILQGRPEWALALCTDKLPSGKLAVFLHKLWMKFNFEGCRVDPKHVQVEKCVYVSSEKKSISREVVFVATIWADMRGFEDVQDSATGYHATVAKTKAKAVSELSLASPEADLTMGLFSLIDVF
jgi:hypothetical protein